MSDHTGSYQEGQATLIDESERALLDKLLADARVYKRSSEYKELLEFVVRLRNFAPFNAMLLQIQKARTELCSVGSRVARSRADAE